MLNSLTLKYFKCFESLDLPLAPLTLLSGTNAAGKSSALQALVLLNQTMREHEWSTRLMLNGKSIKLGTLLDVVNESQGGKSFEIGITDDQQTVLWSFVGSGEQERSSELSLIVNSVTVDQKIYQQPALLRHLLPNTNDISPLINPIKNLTYITAERIGPREVYALEDRHIASVVGATGEHTLSILYWGLMEQKEVLKDLLIETESSPFLFQQVTARMRCFFPGCLLTVGKVQNVNAVTLGLNTSNKPEYHRPINEGFGLTQVLPIVVAALSAQKEDILLIENPEVHLHPAGQALMGQFLAKVASAGVQVILETHSDHILNGIRRFVKSGGISPEQVALHFFRARSADEAQVISPQINNHGDLSCWPDGFFDQFDKDMNFFAGWD